MLAKPKRTVNKALLKRVKAQKCAVGWDCEGPSDPAHIRSRGAGGPDEEWNVIPFCRKHHTEQHKIGWYSMCKKYSGLGIRLTWHGWEFDINFRIHNDKLHVQGS